MLRKLFFLFLVVFAADASAQNSSKAVAKNTEKQGGAEIDYKQIGAPMPPIRIIVYKDTAAKKGLNADSSNVAVTERKSKRKKKYEQEVKNMQQQGVLTNKELNIGANLFLMIFNPTCSHCQEETIMIEDNFSLFKKSRLVLMATPVTQMYIPDFMVFTHLRQHPEITIGVDSAGILDKIFTYQALPQINVYDSEQKLIKIFSGEVAIDSLKKYIE